MSFRDMNDGTQGILLNIWGEVQRGFGTLTAQVSDNRQAAEHRYVELHRRIDETQTIVRVLDQKIDTLQRSPSRTGYLRVANSLLAHWQIILTVLLIAAGLVMGKSPDTIKAWVGAIK